MRQRPNLYHWDTRRSWLFLGLMLTQVAGKQAYGAAPFLRGADISSLAVMEAAGATYVDGVPGDLIGMLDSRGVNWHRIRLFVDPSDPDPFVAQDLQYVIELAGRAQSSGAKLLLDFHYSDTWADPARQLKPAAWRGLDFGQLTQQVYDYTKSTLETFHAAGVLPEMVQIGNEISNGVLWEDGRLWRPGVPEDVEFDNLAVLLSAGIHGARDGAPPGREPQIMIHHDQGSNWGATSYYLDRLLPRLQTSDADVDAIGYSYYPKWHYDPATGSGGIQDLQHNLENTAYEYGKQVVVVETGFASRGAEFEPSYEFPVSAQGQSDFFQAVVEVVSNVPGQRGRGVFWWHPEATPVPGLSVWEDGRYGWFDENGHLLPAADVFAAFIPSLDLNQDGALDCVDIDALVAQIAQAGSDMRFDLNEDGMVDLADRDVWLAGAGAANLPSGAAYLPGDANLDGTVDGQDFIAWNTHKFTLTARWCAGDYDANGIVDGGDFLIWNAFKFQTSQVATVPEPHGWLLIACCVLLQAAGIRRLSLATHSARVGGARPHRLRLR